MKKSTTKPTKKQSKQSTNDLKAVAINCTGATTMTIDSLTPLQGALKMLSKENMARLSSVLATEGITEPISIWNDPKTKKTMILNGHQRVHTLKQMRDDGWQIPDIPVNVVNAKNIKHAKRLVLQLTSQYGTMNPESAFEFINELDLSAEEISSTLNFADFDMTRFIDQYFSEPVEEEKIDVSAHKRVKKDGTEDPKHTCPKCGHEFD